jgi:molybdopterin/thiamine biosynthesis adenylyltransferase
MNTRVVIDGRAFDQLHEHLFQPDRDEHAAIGLAGVHRSRGGLRLLVRELLIVPENDFPPGRHGYRMISPAFVAASSDRAADERLAYVAFHSHPSARRAVSLSGDDLAAHGRLFPHIGNITDGQPVAGIVLGTESAAGDIWIDGSREPMSRVEVVGPFLKRLTASEPDIEAPSGRYDRQARLFGDVGQAALREMRVTVVGAGGGGSLIVEQLAHLGIGHLTVIDFDTVAEHNLSRVIGAQRRDARAGTKKVEVLKRLAARIDPTISFEAVDGDIADEHVAGRLAECDFMFLATDTHTSRLVANAVAHRFLIPLIQVGAKVDFDSDHCISQIYVAVRPVFPGSGCLYCNGLIDSVQLQQESLNSSDRAAQNYLGDADVVDPSVVTLNAISASHATTTMMLAATGLADPDVLKHRLFLPATGESLTVNTQRDPACPFCSRDFARGGATTDLPTMRLATQSEPINTRTRRYPAWLRLVRRLWR